MGPEIRFEGVSRRFGAVTAVDAIELTIAPGGLNGSPFMSSGNHSSAGVTQSATRAPFGQAIFGRRVSIDQSYQSWSMPKRRSG